MIAWASSKAHIAVLDVALVIHPTGSRRGGAIGPRRLWLGLLVIALLSIGLVVAGQSALGVVEALVPHRIERP